MSILAWVTFGLLVGIIANAIDPETGTTGILGAIVLGIIGALIGGFLANLLFGSSVTGLNLTSFIIAVAGSLIFLLAGRVFRRI